MVLASEFFIHLITGFFFHRMNQIRYPNIWMSHEASRIFNTCRSRRQGKYESAMRESEVGQKKGYDCWKINAR